MTRQNAFQLSFWTALVGHFDRLWNYMEELFEWYAEETNEKKVMRKPIYKAEATMPHCDEITYFVQKFNFHEKLSFNFWQKKNIWMFTPKLKCFVSGLLLWKTRILARKFKNCECKRMIWFWRKKIKLSVSKVFWT